MVVILQNKNSATRFQILVEIAACGPNIKQKNIAAKLGVTPQAVSDYIRQLQEEEMIISIGRSSYKVSTKAVNWMLKILRELHDYLPLVEQAVTNITVCAAMADSDIEQGQRVGLKMKDGLLFASSRVDSSATGVAVSSVKHGEDIGISNIEGLVELTRGRVTILQIPSIQNGGSRQVDFKQLRSYIDKSQTVGTIGIEALAALRQAGIEPQHLYGVTEAIIEAARCGVSFTVVCTNDALLTLIKRMEEDKLDYELIDLTRRKT